MEWGVRMRLAEKDSPGTRGFSLQDEPTLWINALLWSLGLFLSTY